MTSLAQLKLHTAKELAALAKREGISNWHDMRKDELARALAKQFKAGVSKRCSNGKAPAFPRRSERGAVHRPKAVPMVTPPSPQTATTAMPTAKAAKPAERQSAKAGKKVAKPAAANRPARVLHKVPSPQAQRRLHEIKAQLAQTKDIAGKTGNGMA